MIREILRSTLAISLGVVVPGQGAAQAREQPPPLGAPKPFTMPVRRQNVLANGMKVTMLPFGAVPKVAVFCVVRTGRIDEQRDEVALADVMAALMREGTTSLGATQLADRVGRMGGTLNVAVSDDRTQIGGEVLSEYAPDFVRLVAQVVRDPLLPEGELARITNGKVREIDLARSEPYWIAHEQLVGALYGEHPYGRAFPTAPMLRGYTIDQVRSFHAGNFNAGRAHLYVVGRFDALLVERAAREAFAGWATGRPATTNAPTPATRYRFIRRDRPSAMLSTIMLGLPIADPSSRDFAALEVTDALLGGSLSSRITSNLRHRNGYAYTPSSGITRYRRSAHWVQQAEVTSKVTGAAVAEILSEIRRLRRETPSMAEVDGVKNSMIGQFVMRNASRTGIVNLLAESDLQGLGGDYLSGYVRRVMGVSPADVRRIAATYFVPERMTLVVVGDESVIAEQLKPYARAAP